jgi:hypothetical protein
MGDNSSQGLAFAMIEPKAMLGFHQGLTCILPSQVHDSGSDEKCLSPLAFEGRCRSLTSQAELCEMPATGLKVCDSFHGPYPWAFSHGEQFQKVPETFWLPRATQQ